MSLRTGQHIWAVYGLQPHRARTFERSNDPAFAEKVVDIVHAIVDNCAPHKHPNSASLTCPPSSLGVPLHPNSDSWLIAVESFFSPPIRRRIKRGVFCSITDLQAAIDRYIREHNDDESPSSGPNSPMASLPTLGRKENDTRPPSPTVADSRAQSSAGVSHNGSGSW